MVEIVPYILLSLQILLFTLVVSCVFRDTYLVFSILILLGCWWKMEVDMEANVLIPALEVCRTPQGSLTLGNSALLVEKTGSGRLRPWRPEHIPGIRPRSLFDDSHPVGEPNTAEENEVDENVSNHLFNLLCQNQYLKACFGYTLLHLHVQCFHCFYITCERDLCLFCYFTINFGYASLFRSLCRYRKNT